MKVKIYHFSKIKSINICYYKGIEFNVICIDFIIIGIAIQMKRRNNDRARIDENIY